MFVGMNEFNPHIGIVFETDIIGDLEEKLLPLPGWSPKGTLVKPISR